MPADEEDGARERYVRAVLDAYVATPGVHGHIRRPDRDLAHRLFDQGVRLHVIDVAFLLAASRRERHNAFSTPLPSIRSLHYFLPVIREVLERPLGYREIAALRDSLGLNLR